MSVAYVNWGGYRFFFELRQIFRGKSLFTERQFFSKDFRREDLPGARSAPVIWASSSPCVANRPDLLVARAPFRASMRVVPPGRRAGGVVASEATSAPIAPVPNL